MKKTFALVLAWSLPLLAFAQTFDGLINLASGWLARLVPLFIAAAVVVFLYGVLTYILSGGDEEKRKAGRDTIIYGIIAIFVMVSVYGIVHLLQNSLGLQNGGYLDIPQIPR